MQPTEQLFVPYLLKHHRCTLLDILRRPEVDRHYGVAISLARLAADNHGVADVLFASPRAMLPFLDAALVKAQEELLSKPWPDRHLLALKENVHARISGLSTFLDATAQDVAPRIGTIGSAHIDHVITVRGTVVRTGAVKLLEARRLYECSRCRHRFVVAADLEAGATVQLPTACPSAKDKPCPGASFRHCEEVALYTSFQEIQLQEGRACLAVGGAGAPRALTVVLQDDLADACQVGDDVEVCGVVIRQFGAMYPGMRCHVGLALQATSLALSRERLTEEVPPQAAAAFSQFWHAQRQAPLEGRNKIVAGMCPQLCGLFITKLAALLMLIGGVPRQDDGEQRVRGELHLLLVGDPGTGKSQFQKYVSKLSPRTVLTSGNASSAAGLTAAAIRDGASWTLEAGALVLANGGVCCIDEFDAVKESDRAALHEAMEQQTCSVAKAGMVTTLHTRTAVFGTCNPRGHRRYNIRKPLSEQINLSGPLLSRFDIVLLLLDDMHPAQDEVVADHILATHQQRPPRRATGDTPPTQQSHQHMQATAAVPSRFAPAAAATAAGAAASEGWSLEVLRQYIAWVKASFAPTLTPAAEEVLSGYYALRRQACGRHAARTTVRMLESLVRVAQAHARLMARHEVLLQDAVVAVAVMESCGVEGDAVLAAGVAQGDHFPERPDAEYERLEGAVLAAVRGEPAGGGLLEGCEADDGWG